MSNHKVVTIVTAVTLLMIVQFAVPVFASSSPATATFSGTARVHIVGKDASGEIVTMSLPSVGFAVTVTNGGAGVGTLMLSVPGMSMIMGPDPVGSGRINVFADKAAGGGNTAMSQFGFTVSPSGGEFQCLMAGRSAGAGDMMMGMEVLQMDVHGTVTAGSLTIT
jgi:hypothetical protein